MRARQVAGAHQKLVHNLAADKFKMLLEQLHPLRQLKRMMSIEPVFKRAVFLLQPHNLLRIVNRRIYLQAIADDARISQQTLTIGFGVSGHRSNLKAGIRRYKTCLLFLKLSSNSNRPD